MTSPLAGRDLLGGPPPVLLPDDAATAPLAAGEDPAAVAARFPASRAAWAVLAETALERGAVIEAYAYARTGYHRSLDALRRSGWKGFGPVPWSHEPNQGYLRAVAALHRAAAAIGEQDEVTRLRALLDDGDPAAAGALGID